MSYECRGASLFIVSYSLYVVHLTSVTSVTLVSVVRDNSKVSSWFLEVALGWQHQ